MWTTGATLAAAAAKRRQLVRHFVHAQAFSPETALLPDSLPRADYCLRRLRKEGVLVPTPKGKLYLDRARLELVDRAKTNAASRMVAIAVLTTLALSAAAYVLTAILQFIQPDAAQRRDSTPLFDMQNFMQRGFASHLDLTVADLQASSAFYDRVLGKLGYVRTSEYLGTVPCWVRSEAGLIFSIGLHKAAVATPRHRHAVGLHHLAFHLSSRADVDDFHECLLHEGISVLDPPAEYDYTPGYYAMFFSDPDGTRLELVHEPRLDEPVV